MTGTFDELLLDTPRPDADMPIHLPTAPKPATPWHNGHPGWPGPPPPPVPPVPPAPLPAGKKWLCHDKSSVKSVGSDWAVPSLHLLGHDYEKGFTGLPSCESQCNGGVKDGCLALEYHGTDKHCVCYNGNTTFTEEQFKAVLTPELNPKDPWTACMLVGVAEDSAAVHDRRHRHLLDASTAGGQQPQHCSQQLEGACLGPHVATQKQKNLIELYSALTKVSTEKQL